MTIRSQAAHSRGINKAQNKQGLVNSFLLNRGEDSVLQWFLTLLLVESIR